MKQAERALVDDGVGAAQFAEIGRRTGAGGAELQLHAGGDDKIGIGED